MNTSHEKWYDPNICLPLDKAIVEVRGNPTFCCDEDSEEEQFLPCIFTRVFSSFNPKTGEFKAAEIFEVCEDEPRRYMLTVKKWRPRQKDES